MCCGLFVGCERLKCAQWRKERSAATAAVKYPKVPKESKERIITQFEWILLFFMMPIDDTGELMLMMIEPLHREGMRGTHKSVTNARAQSLRCWLWRISPQQLPLSSCVWNESFAPLIGSIFNIISRIIDWCESWWCSFRNTTNRSIIKLRQIDVRWYRISLEVVTTN